METFLGLQVEKCVCGKTPRFERIERLNGLRGWEIYCKKCSMHVCSLTCEETTDGWNEYILCQKAIQRLEAIESRLQDYDHHSLQASFDQDDGKIDPLYYDDAECESKLAQEALEEAVLMAYGCSPEEANLIREKQND